MLYSRFSIYKKLSLFLLCIYLFVACKAKQQDESEFTSFIEVEVSNPLQTERESVLISLPLPELMAKYPNFNVKGFVVNLGGEEIASQYSAQENVIYFVISKLNAAEVLQLKINYHPEAQIVRNYPKLTQAELSVKTGGYFENRKYIGGDFVNVTELQVPEEHTDHSYFIRYEGPGWESDKVGYRFYLDWRNGVDVFGKKVSEPILQKVGLDGFDSYHEMQDWGMDVLKVAKSLGVGSIATFENGAARRVDETDDIYTKITTDGAIFSSIYTKYTGWNLKKGKVDLESKISIHAGTRLSKVELSVSDEIENLATGLIIDEKAKLLRGEIEKGMAYLASYGNQSLAGDNLGIAVIYPVNNQIEVTADEFSHIVVLRPNDKQITYYLLAAWEQEKEGIKDEAGFVNYLEKTILELSNPVKVVF